ncbi:conserved hypothetical protein [Histoplasma capsulatum var. duboisii H88]|uniref:Uncharacterized protein n=1 Tax=Ajellomyces capsulatus (strain H88) TaxID=544711 RepID=F0UGL2_AJEC8|nr:conserved hypothetical protein [Histoplasma capsulatum var. duboisii H88]
MEISTLSQALEKLSPSKVLDSKIWGSTDSLLNISLPTPELQLNKLLKESEARTVNTLFANHLSLLFMTHKVDHKTWSIKYLNEVKHKTTAFNLVAVDQKYSAEEIKVYDRQGREYIKLMEEVGSVIMFELSKEVFNLESSSSLLDIVREYMTWNDDGTIHLKNHISTNNLSQQMSVNTGTSNHIENRHSTSPTYNCHSDLSTHECHNTSFSKQLPQQLINNNPSGNHHSAYDPVYYPMQSEPTLVDALIQQSINPSVEGDVYSNLSYRQSVNPSIKGDIYPNLGYKQSVNPSVKGDIYSNPGYRQSVNPFIKRDIYPNPDYRQSVNPSVEGDIYPNPGYRQSVNPSVKGDIYSNPGYRQSVNPSIKRDVYPIAFFQLTEADLQYHFNEGFMVENSSPITRLAQTV